MLYASDFALPTVRRSNAAVPGTVPSVDLPEGGLNFDDVVGRIEKSLLMQALDKSGGNRGKAADLLGLKRTTFLAKLKNCLPAAAPSEETGAESAADANPVREYAFAGAHA